MTSRGPFKDAIETSVGLMKAQGVIFEDGLSDKETGGCEERFGFRFPPDLRDFLQSALPVGDAFPNWRSGEEGSLRERLKWPFEGMVLDIKNNAFWPDEWGPQPSNVPEAINVARRHVEAAPKLIPVFSHRYLPDEPHLAGNPVLSVYQTDIIYYGQNLWDYFEQEFGPHDETWYGGQRYSEWTSEQYHAAHRHVRFWSNLVS